MHGTLGPIGAGARQQEDRPRGLPRWIPAALLILAALAGAWWLFRSNKADGPVVAKTATGTAAPAEGNAETAPRVTVMVPGRQVVENTVRATGSIAARRTSPVGVQGEGGMVSAVLVKEGDFVRRGQVLARIDRSVQVQQIAQMQAGIRQAEADARLAQSELDRALTLVERGFISKADIDRKTATRDSANARVAVARAQLGEMQARVARLDVRAPSDGLILTRSVEAGQVVGAGSNALFTLAQDGAMEMRALLAEQELAQVQVGQAADVQPVGAAQSFTGRVWLKDPIIDPQSRQGIVRIALGGNRELRPGAFARATIASGSVDKPVLPQSAVLTDPKGSYVMVALPDNTVARRPVEIGRVTDAGLIIASGLDGSEKVVANAAAFLSPGEKIQPVLAARR